MPRQAPGRGRRDATPDWPVDMDAVARALRMRNGARSNDRLLCLVLAGALNRLGHAARAVESHAHGALSVFEPRLQAPRPGYMTVHTHWAECAAVEWGGRTWTAQGHGTWVDQLRDAALWMDLPRQRPELQDTCLEFCFPLKLRDVHAQELGVWVGDLATRVDKACGIMKEMGLRAGKPATGGKRKQALPTPPLTVQDLRHWQDQPAAQTQAGARVEVVDMGRGNPKGAWARLDRCRRGVLGARSLVIIDGPAFQAGLAHQVLGRQLGAELEPAGRRTPRM